MSKENQNVGEQIYGGAAELGQFRASVGLWIGSIIGLMLVAFGIYELVSKKHNLKVSATVLDVVNNKCQMIQVGNNTNIRCYLMIKYEYNGITYTPPKPIQTDDNYHVINDVIDIYINPNDPADIALISDTFIGSVSLIMGAVIIGVSVLSWWLTRRYKFFAAAQGVSMGASLITGRNMF
jgi:hypothetical protein